MVSTSPLIVRYGIISVCGSSNFSGFVYSVTGACTTPRILSNGKGLSCAQLGPILFRFPACSCVTAKRVVNGYLGLSGRPKVYTGRPVATSNVIHLSGVRICPRRLSRCVGCTARINRISLHARPNMLAVCTIDRGRGPYGMAVLRACTDHRTCRGRVTSRRFRGCGRKALRVIGSLILSSRAPLGPTGQVGGFVRWEVVGQVVLVSMFAILAFGIVTRRGVMRATKHSRLNKFTPGFTRLGSSILFNRM